MEHTASDMYLKRLYKDASDARRLKALTLTRSAGQTEGVPKISSPNLSFFFLNCFVDKPFNKNFNYNKSELYHSAFQLSWTSKEFTIRLFQEIKSFHGMLDEQGATFCDLDLADCAFQQSRGNCVYSFTFLPCSSHVILLRRAILALAALF
jgi:hypothetical protein